MRRHIPGLHSGHPDLESSLDGLFLVRVEGAAYRWNRQKSFLEIKFIVLEPESSASRSFSGRLYCTDRALWKPNWFLRDFGYDTELLSRDQVDEKSLLNLRGRSHFPQHLERAVLSKPRRIRASCRVGSSSLPVNRHRRGSEGR
jgi:hypothetical protein